MAKKIIRHELVEVVIPKGSTLTRFQFPDIPNLRNSHLWGLEVYWGVPEVQTPPIGDNLSLIPKGIQTQNHLLPQSNLRTGFITLVNYGGKEFLKQAPAIMFSTFFTGFPAGAIMPLEWDIKSFVGQKVSYPKSYIDFTVAPASATEDLTFMFSIYYSLPEREEKQDSGYSFGRQG